MKTEILLKRATIQAADRTAFVKMLMKEPKTVPKQYKTFFLLVCCVTTSLKVESFRNVMSLEPQVSRVTAAHIGLVYILGSFAAAVWLRSLSVRTTYSNLHYFEALAHLID